MRHYKDWTIQWAKWVKKGHSFWLSLGSYTPIWIVTMGNAATCKACGTDKGLKTTGSDNDLNHHTDYYGNTDSGSEVDDSLVRGGERNQLSGFLLHWGSVQQSMLLLIPLLWGAFVAVWAWSWWHRLWRVDPLQGCGLIAGIWWRVRLCWPYELTPGCVWLTRCSLIHRI